jgi:hypothetical protein
MGSNSSRLKKFASAAFVLVVAACASQSAVMQNSNQIVAGMSAESLQQLMGPPKNRQFNGAVEAWQYCVPDFPKSSYVLVWLRSSTVTGMQKFQEEGALCTDYRTVTWENAP